MKEKKMINLNDTKFSMQNNTIDQIFIYKMLKYEKMVIKNLF